MFREWFDVLLAEFRKVTEKMPVEWVVRMVRHPLCESALPRSWSLSILSCIAVASPVPAAPTPLPLFPSATSAGRSPTALTCSFHSAVSPAQGGYANLTGWAYGLSLYGRQLSARRLRHKAMVFSGRNLNTRLGTPGGIKVELLLCNITISCDINTNQQG